MYAPTMEFTELMTQLGSLPSCGGIRKVGPHNRTGGLTFTFHPSRKPLASHWQSPLFVPMTMIPRVSSNAKLGGENGSKTP